MIRRKTPKMLAAEKRLGEKLEVIIPKTYASTGSVNATANQLGVPYWTLYSWMIRLQLSIENRIVSVSKEE